MPRPYPAPQAHLRATFVSAIIHPPLPLQLSFIAQHCGFRHGQRFSNLLHAPAVPVSTRPMFERVAKLVGFPPDLIFVEDIADATPRLVKRVSPPVDEVVA